MPPPKTAIYKPVPPPKPKSYPRGGSGSANSHQSSINEGNYMNSGPPPVPAANNGGGGEYHHYQSSRVAAGSDAAGNSGHHHQQHYSSTNGNNRASYEDADSGQGSSLDREYNYDARYANGGKQPTSLQQPSANNNHSHGQYYYNLPHTGQQQQQQQQPQSMQLVGESPRKPDGLDLSNREYRGSAFELYKKPMGGGGGGGPHQQPTYLSMSGMR